jgi:two-component system OmpR family sensor kinase
LKQVDNTLQSTHEPIEQAVNNNPLDPRRAIEVVAPGTFVTVESPTGAILLTIPARESGHDQITVDVSGITPLQSVAEVGQVDVPSFRTVSSTTGDDAQLRLRVSRLSDGRVLIIGESLEEITASAHRLLVIEVVVAIIALVVAGVVGSILVRVGLRPLRNIEQTALLIADGGDLDHELPGAQKANELGRLASALNTMLERIREAFSARDATEARLRASEERMRRFVADVSHELRTPLSAVSAYTELFERGARDRPDDLARAMRGIDVETGRMHELVEELLLLAQLDEGRPLAQVSVDLDELVVQSIAAARAVSPAWPIALKVTDVVSIVGDPGRLRQVLDNVLGNVRTHTLEGTRTAVNLSTSGDRAVLTIEDDGPGMSAEQMSHIFERFYRSDVSRSRSSGGSGLGMSIVQAIVLAHRGRISVGRASIGGLAIRIDFPVESVRRVDADADADVDADEVSADA